MPRFVILTHDHPTWHWDFMLEAGDVLRTWRLDSDPSSSDPIEATPLPDHRLIYLDYEGPVSNQRGSVQRWDAGQYETLHDADGAMLLMLHGTKLMGQIALTTSNDGAMWFVLLAAPA